MHLFMYLFIYFPPRYYGKQLILQSNLWLSGHCSGSEVYYSEVRFACSFKRNINLWLVVRQLFSRLGVNFLKGCKIIKQILQRKLKESFKISESVIRWNKLWHFIHSIYPNVLFFLVQVLTCETLMLSYFIRRADSPWTTVGDWVTGVSFKAWNHTM